MASIVFNRQSTMAMLAEYPFTQAWEVEQRVDVAERLCREFRSPVQVQNFLVRIAACPVEARSYSAVVQAVNHATQPFFECRKRPPENMAIAFRRARRPRLEDPAAASSGCVQSQVNAEDAANAAAPSPPLAVSRGLGSAQPIEEVSATTNCLVECAISHGSADLLRSIIRDYQEIMPVESTRRWVGALLSKVSYTGNLELLNVMLEVHHRIPFDAHAIGVALGRAADSIVLKWDVMSRLVSWASDNRIEIPPDKIALAMASTGVRPSHAGADQLFVESFPPRMGEEAGGQS